MKFIFWQNILSMHQSSFIRNLAHGHEVLLISEKVIENSRIKDGWLIPDFGKAKIIIAPNKKSVSEILDDNGTAIHIFSGTNAFPMVNYALRLAMNKKIRAGILAEAGIGTGLIGFLRKIKTILFGIKYSSKVDFILAMGEMGVEWYSKNYFPKYKLFPFLYIVEDPENKKLNENTLQDKPIRLIVIAQLIKRKGIDILIKALHSLSEENWLLHIIGNGPEKENLKVLTKQLNLENKITFLGSLPNDEAMSFLVSSDLLILPSRFDGWGAVINEALMSGIPAIASNRCGAACLLDGQIRGDIFNISPNNLVSILNIWIKKGPTTQKTRAQISKWAECITGERVSDFFIDVIKCVYENGNRPSVPWLE